MTRWIGLLIVCLHVHHKINAQFCQTPDNVVRPQDVAVIVDEHRNLRNLINNGKVPGQPIPFEPLPELRYDETLALVSQKLVDDCNSEKDLLTEDRFDVGQNVRVQYLEQQYPEPEWSSTIASWFSEYKNYKFGQVYRPENEHYVQIAWGNTKLIGCGFGFYFSNETNTYRKVYACSYGPSGNVINELPYKIESTAPIDPPKIYILDDHLKRADKIKIIQFHNNLRKDLSEGLLPDFPKAVNVQPLQYDRTLEALAQTLANTCQLKMLQIRDERFPIGQSVFFAASDTFRPESNWTEALNEWSSEKSVFKYEKEQSDSPASHFAQMIWANTNFFGCGYTHFEVEAKQSYRKIHICLYGPSGNVPGEVPYLTQVTEEVQTHQPVTVQEQEQIVSLHNKVRLDVSSGLIPNQPASIDMAVMKYDDILGHLAQDKADSGDLNKEDIFDSRFDKVGQNIYVHISNNQNVQPTDWNQAVLKWFEENKYYTFGAPYTPEVEDYTQMVWAKTEFIGCGHSSFNDTAAGKYVEIFICNYGPGGNRLNEVPYRLAAPPIPLIQQSGVETSSVVRNNLYVGDSETAYPSTLYLGTVQQQTIPQQSIHQHQQIVPQQQQSIPQQQQSVLEIHQNTPQQQQQQSIPQQQQQRVLEIHRNIPQQQQQQNVLQIQQNIPQEQLIISHEQQSIPQQEQQYSGFNPYQNVYRPSHATINFKPPIGTPDKSFSLFNAPPTDNK